jgi:uncharacterized membrane protein
MRLKLLVPFIVFVLIACNNHTKEQSEIKTDTSTNSTTTSDVTAPDTTKPGQAQLDTNTMNDVVEIKADTLFTATGTEPFWSITVTKDNEIRFTNADGEDVAVPYRAPGKVDKTWRYISNKGRQTIVLAITSKKCSDGMSGREYKYEVLAVVNTVAYRGCGSMKDESRKLDE